jgi:TRAP-type uncharacterized transport system substrate-binding protein
MLTNINFGDLANGMRNIFKLRNFLFFLALLAGVITYNILIDYYNPAGNLISQIWPNKRVYKLYSGEKGGFYAVIGKSMEQGSANRGDFSIVNKETKGGIQNFYKATSYSRSIALVPEFILQTHAPMGDYLNKVSPLYEERLHVIYNYHRFRRQFPDSSPPRLSISLREQTVKYLNGTKVNASSVGSGTNLLSRIILNELEYHNSQLRIESVTQMAIDDAYLALKRNSIEIMFLLAGAPLNSVEELLATDSFRLMDIDPAFIAIINQKYNLKLTYSNFNGKYESQGERSAVNAMGSYAYLTASKDVPKFVLKEVMVLLEENKGEIMRKLEISDPDKFQLREFDFLQNYHDSNEGHTREFWKNLVVFVLSVSTSTLFLLWLFIWIASNVKMTRYFRKGTKIYLESVPKHSSRQLIRNDDSNVDVLLIPDQRGLAVGLVEGLNKYYQMKEDLVGDYESGGITETHYRSILRVTNASIEEVQGMLFRRIYRLHDVGKQVPLELIKKYYTVGYIRKDRFDQLLIRYGKGREKE